MRTLRGGCVATAVLIRCKSCDFDILYRFLYGQGVKTTLDIDDELLVRAKAASARERKSLTALIEEGLRLRLRPGRASNSKIPARIPVFAGKGGLLSGVNPLSNRSLLDAADDDP